MEVNLAFSDGTGGTAGVRGHDPAAEHATSLHRWLAADPELRRLAAISTRSGRSPDQGHMGDALEIVNVVLGNSIGLASLITAVAAWRRTRPHPPQVRLERDGAVITLHDGSPEAVEEILRIWHAHPGPVSAPADSDGE
ncbi:hypothetical protein [Streptomyces sp. NPDC101132]|uniref:effector-associated constant component EACC1 n=1 Tax=Streptomyces sp. NPDC101132 TaxID=3366110 RepID=UPI0037F653DE